MAFRKLQQSIISTLLAAQQQTCTTMRVQVLPPALQFPHQHAFRTSAPLLDFYSTLGVARSASDSEIKKAYYKLAKQYHPDTNKGDPGAAKKFQEVQRAYDTLRDPQKRQAYDSMGHSAYEQMEATGASPGDGGGPFPGAGMQVDPEDLFREFFGGGRGGFQGATMFEHIFGGGFAGGGPAGARRRARPVYQTAMRISFQDAMKGVNKTVDLSDLMGMPGGQSRTVELNIPPGVDSGMELRLEGAVPAGPQGMPAGDLRVQLHVAPSPVFRREKFDLYVDAQVPMVDAALGTTVEVPTIDGKAEVKIKPGCQPGDMLRMRGYGVRKDAAGQQGRRGDQFVRVVVAIPRSLTPEQRRLLEEFRSSGRGSSGSSSSSSRSGSNGGNSSSKGRSTGGGSSSSSGATTTGGAATGGGATTSGGDDTGSGSGSSASSGGGGSASEAGGGTKGGVPGNGGNGNQEKPKRAWGSWFS